MFQLNATRSESGLVCLRHTNLQSFAVLAATCFTSARPEAYAQEIRVKPRGMTEHSAKQQQDAVLLRDSDGRLALIATGYKDSKPFFYTNDQIVHAAINPWWQIYEEGGSDDSFEVADEIACAIYSTKPQKVLAELSATTFWRVSPIGERSNLLYVLHWLAGDDTGQNLFDKLGRPESFKPEAR